MKARVTVTLKSGILDPQGKAIHHALEGLGFGGVNDVGAGKLGGGTSFSASSPSPAPAASSSAARASRRYTGGRTSTLTATPIGASCSCIGRTSPFSCGVMIGS